MQININFLYKGMSTIYLESVKNADKNLHQKLTEAGVISDWREPDVIRVAPAPLYNSFEDVFEFVERLKKTL